MNLQDITMEDAPIALLIVQRNNHIIAANSCSNVLFGYDKDELIGKHINILVPPEVRSKHDELTEKYWKDEKPLVLGFGRDLVGVRKDGTHAPLELGLYPYGDNVLVFAIDITVRRIKRISAKIQSFIEKSPNLPDSLPG